MATRRDRLQALVGLLRGSGPHRAETLATRLGVSVRTVYRDMDALMAAGVPVTGTRGRGYSVAGAVTLPPLNLTEPELGALQLALTALAASDLPEQAAAARSLAEKIDAVLPEDGHEAPFAYADDALAGAAQGLAQMPAIRAAIRARQKLRLHLHGTDGPQDVRPLRLDYWGRVWACLAWSETQNGFAHIPLDRIAGLTPLPGLFVEEPGKRLEDWDRPTPRGAARSR